MKNIVIVISLSLRSLVPFLTMADPPTVGVMDLEARGGISRDTALNLSDYLRTVIFDTGEFTVVNREDMKAILKEQGFQQVGCTSTKCAVDMAIFLARRRCSPEAWGR